MNGRVAKIKLGPESARVRELDISNINKSSSTVLGESYCVTVRCVIRGVLLHHLAVSIDILEYR